MEAEICTKMQTLNEKHAAKFPEITLNYSMVKIARLNDAFSKIFELEASPVEGLFDFCACPSKQCRNTWC